MLSCVRGICAQLLTARVIVKTRAPSLLVIIAGERCLGVHRVIVCWSRLGLWLGLRPGLRIGLLRVRLAAPALSRPNRRLMCRRRPHGVNKLDVVEGSPAYVMLPNMTFSKCAITRAACCSLR